MKTHFNFFLIIVFVFVSFSLNGLSQSMYLNVKAETQTGVLKGVVLDQLNDQPISNMSIKISKRIVNVSSTGAVDVRPFNEVEDLHISAVTNEKGEFEIRVPISGTYNLFKEEFVKSGYDTVYNLYAQVLKDNSTELQKIEISKTNYSPEEEKALHQKFEQEKMNAEEKRLNDISNLNNSDNISEEKSINCSYTVPSTVTVSHLITGYNSCSNTDGYSGPYNLIDFVAGVIQWEYYNAFGSSSATEGLKAQAVAARTYALSKTYANCGASFVSPPNSICLNIAQSTYQYVLLSGGVLKQTNYFSRCNGDVTQNANEGKWGCTPSCSLCGNAQTWQLSRPCSGHQPLSTVCQSWVPSAGVYRKIFGPGVGLCQIGTQDFALAGFKFDEILDEYYTNMCIANFNTVTSSNDNPCNPIVLSVSSTCSKKLANNFNAANSSIGGTPCYFSSSSKDVWFRFTVPSSGQYTIETYKGSLTDAVMATYVGSCSSLTQTNCDDDYGSNLMPKIIGSSTPGYYIYVRVWGFGSNLPGTFSICVRNGQYPREEEPIESKFSELNIFPNPVSASQNLNMNGLKIGSTVKIINMQGKILETKNVEAESISISSPSEAGLYIVLIVENDIEEPIYRKLIVQ